MKFIMFSLYCFKTVILEDAVCEVLEFYFIIQS